MEVEWSGEMATGLKKQMEVKYSEEMEVEQSEEMAVEQSREMEVGLKDEMGVAQSEEMEVSSLSSVRKNRWRQSRVLQCSVKHLQQGYLGVALLTERLNSLIPVQE